MCDVGKINAAIDVSADVEFANQKLWGRAQFSRAIDEVQLTIASIKCPETDPVQFANAGAFYPRHDGKDQAGTACSLAAKMAQVLFEPILNQASVLAYQAIKIHVP